VIRTAWCSLSRGERETTATSEPSPLPSDTPFDIERLHRRKAPGYGALIASNGNEIRDGRVEGLPGNVNVMKTGESYLSLFSAVDSTDAIWR